MEAGTRECGMAGGWPNLLEGLSMRGSFSTTTQTGDHPRTTQVQGKYINLAGQIKKINVAGQ
jgi:hypothetical protein